MSVALVGLVAASSLAGCGADLLGSVSPTSFNDKVELVRRGPGGTTRFLAKNVVYRLDKNVAMNLEEMNADILLKDPSLPFVPANKNDYSIQVHFAKVTKDGASLSALMNTYVFNEKDSPLKDMKISFKGDRIIMAGKMKKGVWVGFEMEGTLGPTTDGRIILTPKVVKSMGMRVDGLMSLFGIEMSKLLKMKEEKGLTMQGNNIIMDPAKLYPAPKLIGRVTKAGVANNQLWLEMNDGKARPWPTDNPLPEAHACVAMWGGDVLINTNLVLNAKILQVDGQPETPMVFALEFYREQLEAGYVVSTKSGHMITYLPDANSFSPNFGRFAPPSLPIPGMVKMPSDMGSDMASDEEENEDENQANSRR